MKKTAPRFVLVHDSGPQITAFVRAIHLVFGTGGYAFNILRLPSSHGAGESVDQILEYAYERMTSVQRLARRRKNIKTDFWVVVETGTCTSEEGAPRDITVVIIQPTRGKTTTVLSEHPRSITYLKASRYTDDVTAQLITPAIEAALHLV